MDREPIARSYSKLPLGYEPPLPGACHMKYQGSFTCSSGTAEALALVTLKILPKSWATGPWGVAGFARRRSKPRLRSLASYSPPIKTSPEWIRISQAALRAVDRCQWSKGRRLFRPAKTSNVFAAGMEDKHTGSRLRQVKCASTK